MRNLTEEQERELDKLVDNGETIIIVEPGIMYNYIKKSDRKRRFENLEWINLNIITKQ